MQLRSLHPAERADIGAAGPAAGVLQLTVKQPPEGDTALELGRKYDGVRVLSIRPIIPLKAEQGDEAASA